MATKTRIWRIKNLKGKWFHYDGNIGNMVSVDGRIVWVKDKKRAHKFRNEDVAHSIARFLIHKAMVNVMIMEGWE